MGQIFYACAYDTETKTRCVYEADKFHANCYSYSGAVFSMHFLLRQKPYHIMWGGNYITEYKSISKISKIEVLLGLSTYLEYESFESNVDISNDEKCVDKVKFIGDNNKLWKTIDVWDQAEEYFDWEYTHSVKYSGYLVNHTQRLAIDLADYHKQSKFLIRDTVAAIDMVPVLTETGGGTQMALFEGVTIDSTEELDGTWCGDLLQIVDVLPKEYMLINCCFSEIWNRSSYCYHTFGTDEEDFLLKGNNCKRIEVAGLNVFGKRGLSANVKVKQNGTKIQFETLKIKSTD